MTMKSVVALGVRWTPCHLHFCFWLPQDREAGEGRRAPSPWRQHQGQVLAHGDRARHGLPELPSLVMECDHVLAGQGVLEDILKIEVPVRIKLNQNPES